jgi:hypothetical protein
MLTEDERDYIQDRLANALAGTGAGRANLAVGLPMRLQLQLQEGLLPRLLIIAAVELCMRDGHNSQPPALYSFLRTLLPDDQRVPQIPR